MKQDIGASIRAFGKINLYLDVLAREDDGYHQIVSVMQSVTLCDRIRLSAIRGRRAVELTCDCAFLPRDSRNVAVRAAELFLDAAEIAAAVQIHLEKRIPVAGGMAGGSADAAAVLRGLNRLFRYPLSQETLLSIAAKIGADVPFCVQGGTALCEGHGEILTPLENRTRLPLLLLAGSENVSTPLAYQKLDEVYKNFADRDGISPKLPALLAGIETGNLPKIAENMYNIFEDVILKTCPIAAKGKQALLDAGAIGAMMSGSGPTVFGIFPDSKARTRAAAELRKQGFSPKCADGVIAKNV